MKKLITLLLVLVNLISYSQNVYHKKFTSFDEIDKWNESLDSLKNNFNGDDYIDSVLILLNEYRKEVGVGELILSESLSKVAKLQTDYCNENSIVTHKQESEDLESSFKRGWKFGEYNVSGEVVSRRSLESSLYRNETPPHIIINGFINSGGHSYVMKKSEYIRCGISIVQSTKNKDKYYTVIVFSKE